MQESNLDDDRGKNLTEKSIDPNSDDRPKQSKQWQKVSIFLKAIYATLSIVVINFWLFS